MLGLYQLIRHYTLRLIVVMEVYAGWKGCPEDHNISTCLFEVHRLFC